MTHAFFEVRSVSELEANELLLEGEEIMGTWHPAWHVIDIATGSHHTLWHLGRVLRAKT